MTPYQLKIFTQVYNERQKEEQEEKITLVYLNNFWHPYRCKQLPSLQKILGNEEVKKEMSPEEMLDEVKKMNSAMGGTVY